MKKAWKIFRATVVVVLALLVTVPVGLYIILSTPWAQNKVRDVAVSELKALLATDVEIGRVDIHPFNRVSIYDIQADDDNGRQALQISEISVAFEFFHLLRTGHLMVDFALVDGPDMQLYRQTPESPLNIANIIARLKSDDKNKPKSRYDIQINTVIVRQGRFSYDLLSAPIKDEGFDRNHIHIGDLRLNAYIPRISNEEYTVSVEHLSFNEKSGIEITNILADADIKADGATLRRLSVEMPGTLLEFLPASLKFDGINQLTKAVLDQSLDIALTDESHITPADLSAFCPQLSALDRQYALGLSAHISGSSVRVESLTVSDPERSLRLAVRASADSIRSGVNADFDLKRLSLNMSGAEATLIASKFLPPQRPSSPISRLLSARAISLSADAKGRVCDADFSVDLAADNNRVSIDGNYYSPDSLKNVRLDLISTLKLNKLAEILGPGAPSSADAVVSIESRIRGKQITGNAHIDSASVTYNGYRYTGITADANLVPRHLDATLNIADPALLAAINAVAEFQGRDKHVTADVSIADASPSALRLINGFDDYLLSLQANADFTFRSIDDVTGKLNISNLVFDSPGDHSHDSAHKSLKLDNLTVMTDPEGPIPGIEIRSDIINGRIDGHYRLSTITPAAKVIVRHFFPALFTETDNRRLDRMTADGNNFTLDLRIDRADKLCAFLGLPVSAIHAIDIDGIMSSDKGLMTLSVDAPYLRQGDKIIEQTNLTVKLDSAEPEATVYATTMMPTKKGPMTLMARLNGANDRLDSHIDWTIERRIPLNGSFDFSALFERNDIDKLVTSIDFKPGTINFGDEAWTIKPSHIVIDPTAVAVDGFALNTTDASIRIDGVISANDSDFVTVDLDNITLLDIFETLEIDKALIGGKATGTFIGRNLMTKMPVLECDRLHVDSISYNRCVLGRYADIAANWDNDKKSFYLDADITGLDGRHSRIAGDIFPADESLDISFDADRVPVGFMKPFMEAFASDVEGYASGHARLFGTFKYIDMEGDLYADSLRLKIDFTNTWYTASDSIRLRPGIIDIDNVTIRDVKGHTAMLNGFVRHKFFKEPSFDFHVTDAHDFLCYDVKAHQSPDWYGHIYGNGTATISGQPGVVNIGVNMTTASNSAFTFVLSDRLDADEYSFITFRDSRAEALRDSLNRISDVPEAVRELQRRISEGTDDNPSAYNMDLQIGITPDARMTLVMDPVGGDEIRAYGQGNLRLTYGSQNNDLRMYGTYTLDRGTYNFTLQDIIIKDFSIKEGSSIAFHGDPYSAQLDIQAIYAVNANLSDLDESFLQDKDLNRTNVPVHALLKVSGDMRQPDINFDLEFPTLTSDIYRKVRSIVSTEEMMNRQIIYLLALNRFYTPDYMASTTKGNELFSVASSTISSQLSSMLGKLSDNWSIAPNLRSDRGDFSDVEVDVALSSRLLNNRLLFNGNFGYRDKSLNTNQFIGDFDVEYLLNRRGAWRLKAYNRYNDQNYYVRTAQTTQGIGIVFKKDFDDFLSFLRKKRKKTTGEK